MQGLTKVISSDWQPAAPTSGSNGARKPRKSNATDISAPRTTGDSVASLPDAMSPSTSLEDALPGVKTINWMRIELNTTPHFKEPVFCLLFATSKEMNTTKFMCVARCVLNGCELQGMRVWRSWMARTQHQPHQRRTLGPQLPRNRS